MRLLGFCQKAINLLQLPILNLLALDWSLPSSILFMMTLNSSWLIQQYIQEQGGESIVDDNRFEIDPL
jgi:hypothetical protein